MSAPKFVDSHNMVAFLAKPTESDGFEKILDFLNANPIKYALTLQALVDGKKVIITKTSVRRYLQLEDAAGIECLPNGDIFEQLALMGMVKIVDSSVKFLMYPRFVEVFLDKQVGDMSTHDEIFITPSHTKKVFGNMKRIGKGFSRAVTPLFLTMIVQAQEEIADEAVNEENVPTQSNDPPLSRVNTLGSGEDRLKLKELIKLCTKLSDRVCDLETTKIAQAKEIASLKKRVKKPERKRKSKSPGMKRLFKIGRSAQVVSSKDEDVFNGEEVFVAEQSEKVEEVVSTAEVSATATITTEEITLAQALAELRNAKPKIVVQEPVQSTTTIAPSTIPKAKSITFRDPKQIRLDEELTFKLQAEEEEEQERLAKEKAVKVKEANISWDNVQAMIKADRLLAKRLQEREQEELIDEEKARLFVELLEKRKKHFAALRAQ
ncbi:hypothetical protein Tco_1021617 [Tanacetum coccineum]